MHSKKKPPRISLRNTVSWFTDNNTDVGPNARKLFVFTSIFSKGIISALITRTHARLKCLSIAISQRDAGGGIALTILALRQIQSCNIVVMTLAERACPLTEETASR